MSNDIFTEIPEFAFELYQRFRYKVLYGGRGSGKSWAIAQALILAAVKSPIRIACFREHQKNIEQSSYQVLADWIIRLGLESYFRVLKTTIIARNGSRFIFQGMSTTTEEGIKSMENISIAWFEEAHRMTQRSWELLSKTIRAENSEIWLSFNPRFRYDPVYRTFVVRKRPGAFVRKVNYHLNPWFPKELEEERIIDKVQEPERYAHIWLGEPDDEGQVRKVIPYAVAQACVDAWGMRPKTPAMYHVGFDVADTGADWNSTVARNGSCIQSVDSWHAGNTNISARRAHNTCNQHGAGALYYDSGGVGAGIRGYLAEFKEPINYSVQPVIFGSAVRGKKRLFSKRATNEQFFARRNSQLAWAVRMRTQATKRLIDATPAEKKGINLDNCLFINPRIKNVEDYLVELSQPEWEEDMLGKIRIEKCPDEAPSPDKYDATVLAYARDSEYGLRMRV